jgi:hypothetical protein
MEPVACNPQILELLSTKSSTKQFVYRQTKEVIGRMKAMGATIAHELNSNIVGIDQHVLVEFKDTGEYGSEIWFSGDLLVFHMHTNVFTFPKSHQVWNNSQVKADPLRGYFGVIYVYNFLADSFRYNRVNDFGFLLARIFINKDGHYFVEGKRQFSFLFNQLSDHPIRETCIRKILETAVQYALEFDLTAPEFNDIRALTVSDMQMITQDLRIKTSKEVGFRPTFSLGNRKITG